MVKLRNIYLVLIDLLLKETNDFDFISRVTGLTKEEIKELS